MNLQVIFYLINALYVFEFATQFYWKALCNSWIAYYAMLMTWWYQKMYFQLS